MLCSIRATSAFALAAVLFAGTLLQAQSSLQPSGPYGDTLYIPPEELPPMLQEPSLVPDGGSGLRDLLIYDPPENVLDRDAQRDGAMSLDWPEILSRPGPTPRVTLRGPDGRIVPLLRPDLGPSTRLSPFDDLSDDSLPGQLGQGLALKPLTQGEYTTLRQTTPSYEFDFNPVNPELRVPFDCPGNGSCVLELNALELGGAGALLCVVLTRSGGCSRLLKFLGR